MSYPMTRIELPRKEDWTVHLETSIIKTSAVQKQTFQSKYQGLILYGWTRSMEL
jgi:hypothetical protein